MGFKIIDNKKVEITEDEYLIFTKICQSYTTPSNKGEDLFIDSFVVDDEGLITMLIPPSKKATSMECIIFLMSLQQQQQLRKMRSMLDDEIKQIKQKIKELNKD